MCHTYWLLDIWGRKRVFRENLIIKEKKKRAMRETWLSKERKREQWGRLDYQRQEKESNEGDLIIKGKKKRAMREIWLSKHMHTLSLSLFQTLQVLLDYGVSGNKSDKMVILIGQRIPKCRKEPCFPFVTPCFSYFPGNIFCPKWKKNFLNPNERSEWGV